MKNLKCKVLALCMGASVFLCGKAFSQVPSYVPTNGLVGWWPFNGNANDESGNGNNGTVNGATLTTDRNGVANKAYSFDGVDDYIAVTRNYQSAFSLSIWFNPTTSTGYNPLVDAFDANWEVQLKNTYPDYVSFLTSASYQEFISSQTTTNNSWNYLVCTYSSNTVTFYINGIQTDQYTVNPLPNNYGSYNFGASLTGIDQFYNGIIDDIGIWNRALNDCEIQDLYNSQLNSVAGSIIVSPQSTTLGSTVSLSSLSTSQSLQWQTNGINLGWQNIPSNTTYTDVNTNTLTLNNVQLSNHNQPFRLITIAGNCSDTSNVATIQIADTCITNVTVYDTLYTIVTDTLIINTTLSLPAPNNENTILIYPNPASDHITIDNGNYTAMAGYTIKIENNAGQQVFQSLINQAQFYVDLSTWSGNGLYFVHLIDAQGNTVTVRKIVLQ
jgi:hypothetical protein